MAEVAADIIIKQDSFKATKEINLVGPLLMTPKQICEAMSNVRIGDKLTFISNEVVDDERWLAVKHSIETHDVKQILKREAESFEGFLRRSLLEL